MFLAETVYHEVGHHVQIGILKGNYKKEPVAENWAKELRVWFFVRRLWYLFPLFIAISVLVKAIRAVRWVTRRALKAHAT